MTGEPGDGRSLQRHGPDARPPAVLTAQHPPATSRGVALALAAALVLAACDGGGLGAREGSDDAEGDVARGTEATGADVEAPEVFQVTGQGLWDGRPSLGGVWVAHPDVSDPERVVIRNRDNGRTVIGALFRRERENPGPPLQVSSDAAEALSMLAGAPATLDVTALRREEAVAPAPTEATPPEAAALGAEAVTSPDAASAAADPARGAAVADATAVILGGTLPAPSPATAASALERPFIQLGIFSVEANAQGLVEEMTAAGLPARVAASSTQGQDVWRVLVGPAATEAERDALQARVEAQGFADAYAVTN